MPLAEMVILIILNEQDPNYPETIKWLYASYQTGQF